MDLIQVDQDKCTQCGLCVNVCRGVLGMGIDGPQVIRDLCIGCGQCVAVCPRGALDNVNTPLAKQTPLEQARVVDADTAAQFLRSRRSVRNYQQKAVPRDQIKKLFDIARFAPTACNSQGVSYHVVDKSDTLRSIVAVVVDWAEAQLNKDSVMAASPWAANTASQVNIYRQTGDDVVLRSAPCLVVGLTAKSLMPLGRDNTLFSLAYVQLYAPSIGLATCWAGLFEYCLTSGYQPLLRLLNLPQNMSVTGALMVGYPQYTYKRLVDRNPLQITWE